MMKLLTATGGLWQHAAGFSGPEHHPVPIGNVILVLTGRFGRVYPKCAGMDRIRCLGFSFRLQFFNLHAPFCNDLKLFH